MKMIAKSLALLAALAATMLAVGCMVASETRHTLFLSPDGSLTWEVLELELRSDAEDPAERGREEADYLAAFATGQHPVARSLTSLGAREVAGRLVRAERPYTVQTEGRFDAADQLAEQLLAYLGIPGRAWLERRADETRLVVELWPEEMDQALADAHEDSLLALADALEDHRLVLTAGRFTAAQGFRLEEDGRVAIGEEITEEQVEAGAGRVVLSLAWEGDGR